LEDAVAQIIEVPAGLAEEPMERAVVFELGELRGLNDAGEGTAARAEDPSAGHGPEGIEARLSEARLKGQQEWSKGTDEEIRHLCAFTLSSVLWKTYKSKSASALAFLQQIQAQIWDVFEPFLNFGLAAQAVRDFLLQVCGHQDLA
jgi:hypothetical protein